MSELTPEILKTMTTRPGVYQFLNTQAKVIYVGKARNLKKRLASYFRHKLDTKTQTMIAQAVDVNITITRSDSEALLLESNLIKTLKPRYNVLLRDDKAYPYLHLTTQQTFPRLYFYRGAPKKQGASFGPYPNLGSVRENLALLQKIFQLRQCTDSFFKHRSRPCLQYQIKRCSAPCVNYVDDMSYAQQVNNTMLFLQGKSNEVVDELQQRMKEYSQTMEYEKAAHCRDQIVQLRKLQQQQVVKRDAGDSDVLIAQIRHGVGAVGLLMIRQGRVLGSKVFFPKIGELHTVEELLSAFIGQYYLLRATNELPAKLIIQQQLMDAEIVKNALKQYGDITIQSLSRLHDPYKSWFRLVATNLEYTLKNKLNINETIQHQYRELERALGSSESIQRMECFDISHTQGEATVASCVVFDETGPAKKHYRLYNIKAITAGDDYAAMKQVLLRRYEKCKASGLLLPDVVIIDGGKGQIKQAMEVFAELQLAEVIILGLAKGPERRDGYEKIFIVKQGLIEQIDLTLPARLLLQHIRDEAHRFAITSHRKQRAKKRSLSPLEQIPGVGAKRRQQLLNYFGGWPELRDASIEQIAKVPGISDILAKNIYKHLHGKN